MNPADTEAAASQGAHTGEQPLRDGSGRLTREPGLVGGSAAVVKAFTAEGWLDAGGRLAIAQAIWRLSRLNLAALPGLALRAVRPGEPVTCHLSAPPEGVLPPADLGVLHAAELLAELLTLLWRAHDARVAGLRFIPASLVWQPGEPLRWLAPDLVAEAAGTDGGDEPIRRADVQAVATLISDCLSAAARVEVAGTACGDALALLTSTRFGAADAIATALVALGRALPKSARPRPPRPTTDDGLARGLARIWDDVRTTGLAAVVHVALADGDGVDDMLDGFMESWREGGAAIAVGHCAGPDVPGGGLRGVVAALRGAAALKNAAVQASEVDAGLADPLDDLMSPVIATIGVDLPAVPPRLCRLRLYRALGELLAANAEGGVVVVLDAFQAADELTLGWIEAIEAAPPALPVLFVLHHPEGSREGTSPARWLVRDPLTRPEVVGRAQAMLGHRTLDVAEAEALWTFCAGNRTRMARWCLQRQGGHGAVGTGFAAADVLRELLRAFATLGTSTTVAAMRALMDLPEVVFFEMLEAALDAGSLVQRRRRVAFALPSEARVVLADMAQADGMRWHRRVAGVAALEAPLRVRHAVLGGHEVLAVTLASQAIQRLIGLGAAQGAMRLLDTILGVIDDDDPRWVEFQAMQAYLHLERHEPGRALPLLETLLGATLPLPTEGALRVLQGLALADGREDLGARRAFARALETLPIEAYASRVTTHVAMASLAVARGEPEYARQLAEQALALAFRASEGALQAEAHLALARAIQACGPASDGPGMGHLQEAVRLGQRFGRIDVVAAALRLEAEVHRALDHLELATQRLGDHVALCQVLEDGVGARRGRLDLAQLHIRAGDFEQALADVEALRADLPAGPVAPETEALLDAVRALASLYLGYMHDPLRLLDGAVRQAQLSGSPAVLLQVMAYQAEVLAFLGKHGRAEEVCQAALLATDAPPATERPTMAGTGPLLLKEKSHEAWRMADPDGMALRLRLMLAEVTWRQGARERSAQLFAGVRREAAERRLVGLVAGALLGLARSARLDGRGPEARLALAEALPMARSAGQRLLATEIELVAGDAAVDAGEMAAATASFEAAFAMAEAMASPHHRALALAGQARAGREPLARDALRARAADNLGVYLEQLSASGRRDFLAWAERRRVVDPEDRPVANEGVGAAGGRASGAVAAGLSAGQPWTGSFAVLDEIFGLVTERASLDELVARLTDTFLAVSQASRGLAMLVNEDGDLKLALRRSSQESLSVLGAEGACRGVIERVVATGQTLFIPDAFEDPEFHDQPEVLAQGTRGILCLPLKIADHAGGGERVLGCLYGDRPIPWEGLGEHELGLLDLMARYATVSLELGLVEEESQRKTQRLEMLNDISKALAGTLDLDRLMSLALQQVLELSQGEQAYIFFGPPDGGKGSQLGEDLMVRASMDRAGNRLAEPQYSRSVVARVMGDRQPLTILDVGLDEELQQKASIMIRNVRSVMCVPLLLDDALVGLLYVSSSTANRTFTRHDLDLMAAISAQVALALQNAQAYETIKELNQSLEAKVHARTAELESAMRELTETQAQLLQTEKLATIGTLAGGVAHEINNPLGAVLTNAQWLMREIEDEDHLDSLAMIEQGARRCKEIVDALLTYARPPQATYQTVDMGAVVEEVIGLVDRQIQKEGILVEVELGAMPTVLGDPSELRQVLVQLMLNAVDAIREVSGSHGRLHIRLVRELSGLVLTVRDNGAGMAPETQRRMFDPFFTTKKVGSGTGLGLSVCARIIEKHGGRFAVTSQPGRGTTMALHLPVP